MSCVQANFQFQTAINMVFKLTGRSSIFLKSCPKNYNLTSKILLTQCKSFSSTLSSQKNLTSTFNFNRFYSSSGGISKEMEAFLTEEIKAEKATSKPVPGFEIKADGAMVELNRKYKDENIRSRLNVNGSTTEVEMPESHEIENMPRGLILSKSLTVEHIDRAIAIYQEEFKSITCNLIEILPSRPLPKNPEEIYDDSDWQIRWYKKKRYRLSEMIVDYNFKQKTREIISQRFDPKRTGTLGPDLAAAHFITYRGGKVKFYGSDKWISSDVELPRKMDTAFKVENLDASNCKLYYEGLDNFINLKQLAQLDLSSNPGLDDWACGRLACHFRNSNKLKYLNLSDNTNITAIGLQSLVKIPSLETVVITGTKAASYSHLELLMLLFQDINPRCRIEV